MRQPATLFALVFILLALIFAQLAASGGTAQAPLVIADGVAVRELAIGAVDPQAAIYLTNATLPNRIFVLDAGNSTGLPNLSGASVPAGQLAAFAGTGAAGSAGDGGAALSAEFNLSPDSLVECSGVAVATDGTIYLSDTENSTIRAIASATSTESGVVRSIAGRWAPAQNISLTEPMGLAVDRAGDLFIADHAAGSVDEIPAGDRQLEILAHVVAPASLGVTPDGSKVFVASPDTGAVFAINVQTRAIATVAGFASAASTETSSSVSAASNGPCSTVNTSGTTATGAAQAICPAGVAVDGGANLFVSDANSGRILRVDGKAGSTTVTASGLHTPGALAFDAKGNLYIAEQGADRVVAMLQAGVSASNISFAPASATYVNEPLGGNTPGQLFTLTNSSTNTIAGLNLAVGGTNPADFQIQGRSCLTSLAASSSCTVNVAFVPQATGARSATLTASDSVSTDSASASLSGTGDDFQMSIPNNQPDQVSVQQGGTATFTAQVVPDNTFGKNGERVVFVCPANVPAQTTCSFNPASVSVTPGTPVSFQVIFLTTNVLGTTGSFPFSAVPPNPGNFRQPPGGGPGGVAPSPAAARRVRNTMPLGLFSALAGLLAVCGVILAWKRQRYLISTLAFATLSIAALAGCHHKANPSLATPTGETTMSVQGNVVDANGNTLNASRSVSITLTVTAD